MARGWWPAILIGLGLGLGGCGTTVPDLQEPPATPGGGPLLVRAITESIFCELRNSVVHTIEQDSEAARLNNGVRTARWFDDWGVQVALTLTVEERSSVNASGTWINPLVAPSTFSLASGLGGSVGATRTDKMNYFFTVRELYDTPYCPAGDHSSAPPGSLLITSDLKLRDWLASQVIAAGTGTVSVPASAGGTARNALSHEVRFELLSSGNVTPSWRIAEAVVNPSSPFFSTSRNRVHDLILTFGPVDKGTRYLSASAASTYLASQIGVAVNQRGF